MNYFKFTFTYTDTVSVICSLVGLLGEVGDVTDSELDLSDVVDAVDEFCEDRRSLDS